MQVFSIREAAANNLKRLAEEFGSEWAMQHIVPQVSLSLSLSLFLSLSLYFPLLACAALGLQVF